MDSYFTKSMAEWMLEYATGLQTLGNMKDACREIVRLNAEVNRLNEVINSLKATNGNIDAINLYHVKELHKAEKKIFSLEEQLKYYEDGVAYDDGGFCDKCGSKLLAVRPGKWQCPECE